MILNASLIQLNLEKSDDEGAEKNKDRSDVESFIQQ